MKTPCKFCEGTGLVDLDRCVGIVHGRQCKNSQRNDPEFYALFPERAYVKPYCGMHGNMLLRAAKYQREAESS